jgi:glycosyltransferase involved in cell wall biosynthesis
MRVAFFSTMQGLPWGGSEELWSRAAAVLRERGHQIAFNCRKWPTVAPPLAQLIADGGAPCFRSRRRIGRSLRRVLERLRILRFKYMRWLQAAQPDLVVISFACHTDDPQIANTCRMMGIPYVVVLQAAGPNNWIDPRSLEKFRSAYACAERCFFVSAENRDILLANLAIDLPRSEIVDNPFSVGPDAAPAWPSTESGWKLACVARVHFMTKSQDLLVRVLQATKWRTRPLKISLWGNDNGSLGQLRQLIDLHQLHDQISYEGFTHNIEALWSQHHGLLLPSRMEGNALSLVEAMMCGRVPITTNVGRAAELISDNESGFLAPAATAELVDEVLERAWARRHDWREMGQRAAQHIRQRHSLRPAEEFAQRILDVASPKKSRVQRVAA